MNDKVNFEGQDISVEELAQIAGLWRLKLPEPITI